MKLVQLLNMRDGMVYVNPEKISYVQKDDDGTEINFWIGESLMVQEDVGTVVELLKQSSLNPDFLTVSTLTLEKDNA